MTKDYYKILEIPETSSREEIKKAYRKLARKWHPDIAGSDDYTISRFKEINEAYEVLTNMSKKADYDTARRFYNYAKHDSFSSYTQKETSKNTTNPNNSDSNNFETGKTDDKKKGFSFKWEEFIANKYRETQFKKENKAKTPQKGNDIFSDVEISVFEAINGTTKIINMLQTQVCPKCGGRKFVNGAKCSNCAGKGQVSNYKRFTVKIPAGIKNNSKIRLAEEGEKGINGGKNGDLYLTVHIKEPQNYKTDGLNILKTISVTPFEAVLGAEISVPTLKGNVVLKITPCTQNGQKIRLSGCGIEQNSKMTGDMIVTIEIQIPKNITNEEIELYKRLRDISAENIRN